MDKEHHIVRAILVDLAAALYAGNIMLDFKFKANMIASHVPRPFPLQVFDRLQYWWWEWPGTRLPDSNQIMLIIRPNIIGLPN